MTTFTIANSTDEIRTALLDLGIKVAKKASRMTVVRLAEKAGIWAVHAGSVVPDSYKIAYGPDQNCGDDIAEMLKGWDVASVAEANGIDAKARWGSGRKGGALNPGMVRMNLGNVLRGRVKRGEYAVVGSTEYNKAAKTAKVA